MKLTLKTIEAAELFGAIRALDGYERPIKDQHGERMAKEVYKLSSPGPTRMKLALNFAALKPVAEAFDRTRQQVVFDHPPPELPAASADFDKVKHQRASWEREKNLTEAVTSQGEVKVEVDLQTLKWGDLNPAENPIPPSVLATLLPILTDLPGD